MKEPLTDEELQSFEDYAKEAIVDSGGPLQWADYTLRLIDEVRNRRSEDSDRPCGCSLCIGI